MSKDTAKQARFVFTPQHEEILKAMYTYHMLTAKQITALVRPTLKLGNLTTIQTRLGELVKEKYLHAHHLATSEGQRPYVYSLNVKGKHHLEDIDHEVTIYYSPSEIEGLYHKKPHTLELNNFLILAASLSAYEPRLSFTDLKHELMFEREPLEYPAADTGKLKVIKPDALFKLHLTREGKSTRHYFFWVELDRGNVSDERMRDKMAAIYDYINRGFLETYYGRGPVLILFVATDPNKRAENLKKLFRKEFLEVNPKSAKNQMFKFAEVPPLMQPQPSPLAIFTQPYWTTAYGDSKELQTIIEL